MSDGYYIKLAAFEKRDENRFDEKAANNYNLLY